MNENSKLFMSFFSFFLFFALKKKTSGDSTIIKTPKERCQCFLFCWGCGLSQPYSTSFACGLLALPSLIHTLKNLPLPPLGSKEGHVTQYPFCMWFFGLMGCSLTYKLNDLLASCKVRSSNLTHRHKDGVTTHHTDVITRWCNHQYHGTIIYKILKVLKIIHCNKIFHQFPKCY